MFSWFVTRQGRLFTRTTVGFITASIFGTHVALSGPFSDSLRGVFQMYTTDGSPRPVRPNVLAEAKEVLEKCDLTEAQKNKVTFFVPAGLDICHIGGYNSPWGTIIGLPLNLNEQDINTGELKIVGKEDFDWITEGMDLIETLQLSKEAKQFAIAREIYSANFHRIIENGLIASLCFYFPAVLGKYHNKIRKAYEWPISKRLLIYGLLYAAGLTFYFALKDPIKHFTEIDADKKAAKMNPEYLKGGIEFYIKLLERNRELRVILGDIGERIYTIEGNLNYTFFTPKLPISKRLETLQMMSAEEK